MSARAINRFILPRARLGCRSTFAHTQHPATVLSVGGFTNETPANAPELPPFRVRCVAACARRACPAADRAHACHPAALCRSSAAMAIAPP